MATHNILGRWGEDMAADYLSHKGYDIIERNWRSGHRDIDIIAWDGGTLVIVEVKTRRNRLFADPEWAVDYKKLQSLRIAANHYIKFHHVDNEVRLDVVTVTGTPETDHKIEHIENYQW
jgi:putative endonuclease